MRHLLQVLLGLAVVGEAGVAAAEPAHPHVVVLRPVQVSGRIQTPLAAVEVARVEPKLALKELRPAFTDRITKALCSDPY